MFGKHHSDETKQRLSNQRKGKCSHPPVSEETKRKHRIAALNHMEKHGVIGYEDKGSFEYFWNLNPSIITNYRLKDIGYILDGYDIVNNVAYEYDTPYHNRLGQKRRDRVRQNNIINYFKQIDNPLKSFIRVNADTKETYECIS